MFSYTVLAIAAPSSATQANGPARADATAADSLGSRLRAERSLSGTSLREMARRLGISPSALSQIERGLARPSLITMVSLATELQLSLDDLLGVGRPRGRATSIGTGVNRAVTRVPTELCPGVRCSTLVSESELGVELFLACFEPGAKATTRRLPLFGAKSQLVAVVVAGSLHFESPAGEALLVMGDAAEFERKTLRAIRNDGAEGASVFLGSLRPRGEKAAAATRSSSPARHRRG